MSADPVRPVVHLPDGGRLRTDLSVGHLRIAVAKALKAQLTTSEQWRELSVLTGTDRSDFFVSGRVFHALDFGGDQLDEAIHDAVPLLLGSREETQPDGIHLYLDNVVVLEAHLNLPAWLAQHDADLYRHLYPAEAIGEQDTLTLDELLAAMDRTAGRRFRSAPRYCNHAGRRPSPL